jgi:tetratricopeptide (TPR) repeat protein
MRKMSSTSFSTGRNRNKVLVLAVLLLCAPLRAQDTSRDPDRLYADREHLQSAIDAATVWESRLKTNAKDFESAWKLARASYWLGGHVAEDARRAQYERGIEAARQASLLQTGRPEGYFWMAANMGAMAESFGLRAGIKYRGPVKKALETVLMLDPGFQQGSADRALGRWYLKVPRLFGGSKDQSVEHLKKSLTYDPASTASHYFLAETYLEMDRPDEARQEAQKVLDLPANPNWAPEDREFKQKAKTLLERLR